MRVGLHTATLAILSLLLPGAAGQTKVLGLKTPFVAGAPLQATAATFNDTTLAVLLVNVSNREVRQVTMGVVLEDSKAVVTPTTRTGIACEATVPADGFLLVRETNIGFDSAAPYFRSNGITEAAATVGVTSVRFSDGSDWTYPLAAKGRFDEREDRAARDAMHALFKKQFPEDKDLSWLYPNQTGKVSTCRK